MWTDNSGDDADVHEQEPFGDDEEDEEDKENTKSAGDHDDYDNQPQRLRCCNGVLFHRVEKVTDSKTRFLFQKCL